MAKYVVVLVSIATTRPQQQTLVYLCCFGIPASSASTNRPYKVQPLPAKAASTRKEVRSIPWRKHQQMPSYEFFKLVRSILQTLTKWTYCCKQDIAFFFPKKHSSSQVDCTPWSDFWIGLLTSCGCRIWCRIFLLGHHGHSRLLQVHWLLLWWECNPHSCIHSFWT